jgi:hypothetical protein
MLCPFYEEIVVAYCRATPVKKMLPASRLQPTSPCMLEGHAVCPFYQDMVARLAGTEAPKEAEASPREPSAGGASH